MESLVEWTIRWRYQLLMIALLAALAGYRLAPSLQLDRSIENMFAPRSTTLADYQRLQRTCGGSEMVLAVYRDPQWRAADGSGLRRVTTIRQQLAAVPGVRAVLGIDQTLPGNTILGSSPLAQRALHVFEGFTHGADGETVSLICMLDRDRTDPTSRTETIDRLRRVMGQLPSGAREGTLAGEPVLLVDGFRYLERDGRQLSLWSTVLLAGTIIVVFRSLRWVLIPLVVVQWTIIVTRALLALTKFQLTMVSSMLTAVVMVIGVATLVHVMVRYTEERERGANSETAFRRTAHALAWPIVWSCLTDAVGFIALTLSHVGPVQDYGVMMASGSLLVLVSVAMIVPALALVGRGDRDPHQPWGDAQLVRQLDAILATIRQRPRMILLGLSGLTMWALSGLHRLPVETDFTRNFRRESDIALAYHFVEDHLGGAGVCDLLIPAPEPLDWPFLERVRRLGNRLQSNTTTSPRDPALRGLTKTLSLADGLIELSPIDLAKQPTWLQQGLIQSGLASMQAMMPEFYTSLIGRDPQTKQRYLRMMLRVQERQTASEKRALLAAIQRLVAEEFPQEDVTITGYFVLLSRLIDSVLADQWRTFTVAVIGIGILMLLAFRDYRLAAIALIPNTFPILIVLGAMGWLSETWWPDLRANLGTAMIAAVSLGLSIDSSIHYILRYTDGRRAGQSVSDALHGVQRSVGKSLVLSTIALSVGFLVLASSQFVPTICFGVLVTLAMLGGLIGNLIALPLLIEWVHGSR